MGFAFSTISTNSKSTKATGNIDFQYNDSSVSLQLVKIGRASCRERVS